MRRTLFFVASLLACAAGLCFGAYARVFVDDMNDLSNNNIKRYTGLRRVESAQAALLPDNTAFTLANPAATDGQALYRVQNATLVRVSIATQSGTFVAQKPGEPDKLVFGAYQENMGNILKAPQALLSKSTGGVYTQSGGWMRAVFDNMGYVFTAADKQPGSVCNYGVNISYSIAGDTYVGCRPTRESVQIDHRYGYCLEVFFATVPAEAGYILVEINDFYTIPSMDGRIQQNPGRIFTCLTEVELSGDKLLLGEPEPVITLPAPEVPPEIPESTSSSGASSSSKAASGAASAASSKFEGTIVSSSKSSASSSGSSGSSSKSSKSAREDSESSEPERSSEAVLEAVVQEPVIYELPARAASTSRFTGGIIVYIVVVSAAVAALLVFRGKR